MATILPADLVKLTRQNDDIVVLQGTIDQAGLDIYYAERIPQAMLFDVRECSDERSPLPFTLCSQNQFGEYVKKLGVRKGSQIVVYDATPVPIKASARIWWMFRLFGHDNITILSGGLAHWKECGFRTETGDPIIDLTTVLSDENCFIPDIRPHLLKTKNEISNNVQEKVFQLMDGRPRQLFDGGAISGAVSIPFSSVLDGSGKVRKEDDLSKLFGEAGIDLKAPAVATCLTGVTACSLVLAAFICGNHEVAVYDGSWNEWKAAAL